MKPQRITTSIRKTTEDPSMANRFDRILGETVEAMEEAGVRYVFIGGIASGGLGRPRSTRDIDLFVVPEQAEQALNALEKKGFRTEKTDPSWLYKGFKEDILVDVIFKSKGEIYLDSEMYDRIITAKFHDRQLRLVSPEDLVIIKAVAHSELTPSHWHDAIALLSYANLDWQYLIKRARRAPRRILSLLLYAQSSDIWIPNYVIHELYSGIFENAAQQEKVRNDQGQSLSKGSDANRIKPVKMAPAPENPAYGVAHLREKLAEDDRTNELDIQIEQQGGKVVLRGDVLDSERRDAVGQVAREVFPAFTIENRIRVANFDEPSDAEDLP